MHAVGELGGGDVEDARAIGRPRADHGGAVLQHDGAVGLGRSVDHHRLDVGHPVALGPAVGACVQRQARGHGRGRGVDADGRTGAVAGGIAGEVGPGVGQADGDIAGLGVGAGRGGQLTGPGAPAVDAGEGGGADPRRQGEARGVEADHGGGELHRHRGAGLADVEQGGAEREG